jgi:hypothetical protein
MANTHKYLTAICILFNSIGLIAQDQNITELWNGEPRIVETFEIGSPPSDAVILFDGSSLSKFSSPDSTKPTWIIKEDYLVINPVSKKGIITNQKFGSCQFHIEWRTPTHDQDSGQLKGNSGIYFMDRYEVQILDSWNNQTYFNGQAASIYKQHTPLVNASKKPGEWQVYDIVFTAPQFGESGSLIAPARFTVFHNGVLVQNNVALLGQTRFIGMPFYEKHEDKEPIFIQNHGDEVCFRNIWLREL